MRVYICVFVLWRIRGTFAAAAIPRHASTVFTRIMISGPGRFCAYDNLKIFRLKVVRVCGYNADAIGELDMVMIDGTKAGWVP